MSRFLFIIFTLVFIVTPVCSQDTSRDTADDNRITIGTTHEFTSEILGDTRTLVIGLPADYHNRKGKTYPVLYLLDGPFHFRHVAGVVEFLTSGPVDVMPDTIIVAVGNTERSRDMTPPVTKDDPDIFARMEENGGADNFIRFFQEELFPFVESEYRTHPHRILVGHSLGGLFAVHTLVHQPEAFDAYVAVSPSMQWDDHTLVEQADAFFSSTDTLHKSLYLTMGSEGGAMLGGLRKLQGVLREYTPNGFEWDVRVMPEETHNSVVHRSVRQGLEFVFQYWNLRNPEPLYKSAGLAAIEAHFAKAEPRYGLERAMSMDTIINLAFPMIMTGRLDEARALIETDPERFPPMAMMYSILADGYKKKDRTEDAIACFSRAIELNPADDIAKEALADLGVDAATIAALATTAEVPRDVLSSYIGTYVDNTSGMTIKVMLSDAGLVAAPQGQQEMALTPIAHDRFVTPDAPIEIVFTSSQNAVMSIQFEMGGQVMGTAGRQD